MPSPNCKLCDGKGEHPHCEGCTEWVSCQCSVNDKPPATDSQVFIADWVEAHLRGGGKIPLRNGFEIAFYDEDDRFAIAKEGVRFEIEPTLGNIFECAMNHGEWS